MNAAIVYNEGEIIVNTVIDISEVLEKYRFDGKKYVNIETNKKVNIKNLKNNSESFTYTFGLLFEMARVLKNAKDETDMCTMMLIRWEGDSDGEYRELGRKI
ncbi:hypothetical protein DXB52_12975 [Ruminococcus sp. OM04-4AA]|nr:hypothetical protein DXB52_12975 [Ruminococcus sp. OM04-4AA]